MRLLNVHTYKLHTFYGDAIPKYAILSHTWLAADEEVTFLHLQTQEAATWRRLPGAKKIFYTCQQARDDGHTWAWVDTCCIDKSNNAELSEAINSMFRWYQRSEVCYVYLSDYVCRPNSDLFTSRWWTRAWTLQELVAPECVQFFDAHWQDIGTKSARADDIAPRMSIDVGTLRDSKQMYSQCVAQRMSWAAHREATREEDLAYSLLGIFNINMTMQYGEGEKAFVRLQQEITRTTSDISIFAWGLDPRPLENVCFEQSEAFAKRLGLSSINASNDRKLSKYGLYADSPRRFRLTQIKHLAHNIGDMGCEERRGVQNLTTMLVRPAKRGFAWLWTCSLALLPCVLPGSPHYLVGILLSRWGQDTSLNTRCSFNGEIFTCLISSEHIGEAFHHSIKVITMEYQLLQTAFRQNKLERTLVIQVEDMEHYPFQVLQPAGWLRTPGAQNRFSMLECPTEFKTILGFQHRDAHVTVFVGFTTPGTTIQDHKASTIEEHMCVIRAEPSSTSTEFMLKKIDSALEYPVDSRASFSRVCGRDSCKHDCLRVTVETTTVLNQALTKLTLAKSKDGSFKKELAAVCVDPGDRMAIYRRSKASI